MDTYDRIARAMFIARHGSHDDIHKILSAKMNDPDSHIVHSEEFHNAIKSNTGLNEKSRLSLATAYVMNKPHYPMQSIDGDTDDDGSPYSYAVQHDSHKTFTNKANNRAITLNPMQDPITHIGLTDLTASKNKQIAHGAHDVIEHYVDAIPDSDRGNGNSVSDEFFKPLDTMFEGEYDKGRREHYHNLAEYGQDYHSSMKYHYMGNR